MTVAKLDVIEQFFDDAGHLLADGVITTYAAGTTTPLVTYSESTGTVPNPNPLTLGPNGRADLWFTVATAYKVVVADSAGVVLRTVDGIVAPNTSSGVSGAVFPLDYQFHGTAPPKASEWLGGFSFPVAVEFPADWSGAFGHVNTPAAADFVISLRLNATTDAGGSEVGTVTFATGATTAAFATTAGAVIDFAIGDHLSAWAPGTTDATMNDFNFTLIGAVSA